jgi:threonine dehydrogenase-like Zn-dependent dehydrogenase
MRTIVFEKNIPKVLLVKALRPLWPGIVYSPLSPTRYQEIPDPPLPGPDWLRVRNRLGGICGTDLHILQVLADPLIAAAALPGTDRIYLGHEVVGTVSQVGAGVRSLKPGDRVVLDARGPNCLTQAIQPPCRHCREGNFALCENASSGLGPEGIGGGFSDSFIAHESELYRLPDEIDDEAAVLVEPLSVGVRAALRRLPRPGEQALVIGCGIIGLCVLQAVRALSPDCRITAMARHPHQARLARALGADEVLPGGDGYAAAARITGARLYNGPFGNRSLLGGFDVIFDNVGSARTVQDSLRWTRAGGTLVLVGVNLQRMRADLTPVWGQEINLVGMIAHGMENWNGAARSTYDLTCELLLQGRLKSAGLVTHRFPLEQWREATRVALDKRSGAVKVVFDYGEASKPDSRSG